MKLNNIPIQSTTTAQTAVGHKILDSIICNFFKKNSWVAGLSNNGKIKNKANK
jgi:hypothetical protein